MKRFTGTIYWINGYYISRIDGESYKAQVNRAILEKNVLRIEHSKTVDFPSGLIRLKSEDGFEFIGSMKYIDENKSAATVNLEYYENQKNSFLIGKWAEAGDIFTCFVSLNEVEEFES